MNVDIFNIIGLSLDIMGVLIVWKFGIPNDIRSKGESFLLLECEDKDEIKKAKIYSTWQGFGLAFIVAGFIFQLLGNIFRK